MPVDAVYLWLLTRVFFCCTRGLGCNAHPAFPAPSVISRVVQFITSDALRRENAAVRLNSRRHCEERSDEAIQTAASVGVWIASLRSQ